MYDVVAGHNYDVIGDYHLFPFCRRGPRPRRRHCLLPRRHLRLLRHPLRVRSVFRSLVASPSPVCRTFHPRLLFRPFHPLRELSQYHFDNNNIDVIDVHS